MAILPGVENWTPTPRTGSPNLGLQRSTMKYFAALFFDDPLRTSAKLKSRV
jgi:hypothetical protein